MRSRRRSLEEQFRLVTECRQSGLTDAQWCMKNDISPSSFYNWTSRLRQKGVDLPTPSAAASVPEQDIVRIDIVQDTPVSGTFIDSPTVGTSLTGPSGIKEVKYSQPVMELSLGEVTLKISNEVNVSLLASLMVSLKDRLC